MRGHVTGGLVGVALASAALGADALPERWRAPIAAEGLPKASSCGACHPAQAKAWSASGHRQAWTAPLFQAGFAAEPQPWCAWCHAPLPEMRAEIARNLPWYERQDPRRLRFGPDPVRAPEPLAEDGVTCVACHQPDGGAVLAPVRGDDTDPGGAQHPIARDARLTDGTVCRGCHEFPTPVFGAGRVSFTALPMQSTYSEWAAWRDAGGDGTCVSCHMPGGDHAVRGVHDRVALAEAVALTVTRDRKRGTARFEVRSVGVGHALPSGDLFRHLTLELSEGGAPYREIARFGRRFALHGTDKQLVEDTSLQPGVAQVVTAPAARGARFRLRWHDGSEQDELRGWVDPASITVDLVTGAL